MKVKKLKFKQILKLYLLNSKFYEKPVYKESLDLFVDSNVLKAVSNLKKALHIIFQFHNAEKRIMFIGIPPSLESKINNRTNHLAVPKNFDVQNLFFNNYKNKKLKDVKGKPLSLSIQTQILLPKLSKRPDLIVLFSHNTSNSIVNESYLAKIPLVALNAERPSPKVSYNVTVSTSNSVLDKNLFCLGLNFLFKNTQRKMGFKASFLKT